jgi:hypothetical protein
MINGKAEDAKNKLAKQKEFIEDLGMKLEGAHPAS